MQVLLDSGAGTANPSGAPELTPSFSGVRVARSLVVYVCFLDRCLSLCTFLLHTIFNILKFSVSGLCYVKNGKLRK
jgi:hypothetical protein